MDTGVKRVLVRSREKNKKVKKQHIGHHVSPGVINQAEFDGLIVTNKEDIWATLEGYKKFKQELGSH